MPQAHTLRQGFGGEDVFLGEINTGYSAAAFMSEITRSPTQAATDIE